MHPRYLKKAGETHERLHAVAAWREAPYFTDAEPPQRRHQAGGGAVDRLSWGLLRRSIEAGAIGH